MHLFALKREFPGENYQLFVRNGVFSNQENSSEPEVNHFCDL